MKILRSFNTAHEAVQWMTANRIEGTFIEMSPALKSVGYRGSDLSNGNYHVVLKDITAALDELGRTGAAERAAFEAREEIIPDGDRPLTDAEHQLERQAGGYHERSNELKAGELQRVGDFLTAQGLTPEEVAGHLSSYEKYHYPEGGSRVDRDKFDYVPPTENPRWPGYVKPKGKKASISESELKSIVKSVVTEVMDSLKAGTAVDLNRDAKYMRGRAEEDMSLGRGAVWDLSDDANAKADEVHEILSNPDHPTHKELLGTRPSDPVRQQRVKMLLGKIADRFRDAGDFAYDRADAGEY